MQIFTKDGWKQLGETTFTVTDKGQWATKTITEAGYTITQPDMTVRCETKEAAELLAAYQVSDTLTVVTD